MTIINKRYRKSISYYYFLCILVSIMTVIYNSMNTELPTSKVYSIIVGISFIIQICIITFNSDKKLYLKVSRKSAMLMFLFISSSFLPIFKQSILGDINPLDVINSCSRFFLIYIYWIVAENNSISKNDVNLFMKQIVYLGIIACFYNFVVNFKNFSLLFNNINPYEVAFKSFFTNRNAFAQFLLFCIISNSYLLKIYNQKKFKISFIILILNLIMTLSRTAIACSIIFLVVFNLKNINKITAKKVIVITITTFFVVMLATNPLSRKFISHMIVRAEYGTGRFDVWNLAFMTLKNNGLFIGIGYENSIFAFQIEGYSLREFHSFYLETIVGGGLLELILNFLIIKYIIDRISIIRHFDKELSNLFRLSIFVFLIYALFESISIFRIGYVGTIFTIYIFTIPLVYSNNFT